MATEDIDLTLDLAYEARRKILAGQSYKMSDGRELRRAELDAVEKLIQRLERKQAREARGGGMGIRLGVPSRM